MRLENKFASGTCVPDGLVNCEATLSSVDCPTLSVCCIDENSIVVLAPTTSTRSSTTPPIVAATTSTTSTNVESTGSAAPTAKFPIAIVVGSVVGFIVLVAVVLALVCVMKKRRRADHGGGAVGTMSSISSGGSTGQIEESNRSQYAMISLRPPPEVEVGAPYGSTSVRPQYENLQMTQAQGYDVVPSEL